MNWKNAPATVWLFIALMLATLVVAALPGDPTDQNWPVALFFTALWSFLLLRGSRAGWWIVTVLYAITTLLLTGMTVWPWDATLAVTIVLVIASLATLLMPQTRAWVGVGRDAGDPLTHPVT
jgi:hypothetical protein